MVAPFNYQIQVQDPFASAVRTIQLGQGLQQAQMEQQQAALNQQILQRKAEQQAQFSSKANEILTKGLSNATAEDFTQLSMLTDKDTAKTLQDTFKNLGEDKQRQTLGSVSEVVSALAAGKTDIAAERLKGRAELLKKTGRPQDAQEASVLEAQAELATKDPEFLQFDLTYKLATLPGGKAFLENIEQSRKTAEEKALSPERLAKAKADALKAGVEADFAGSKAVADLNLTQAQIDNYAATQEIARENLKIAKLGADLKREENTLKRQELQQKLDDAKVVRDEKVRKNVSDANTAFANFDNFLNTADRALQGWGRNKEGKVDVTKPKGYVESATGPLSTRLPTVSQDVADFEETIETLKSQAFLSQVEKMKGLGALTEREGAALTAALTNLNLRQSPQQLGRNLQEAQRLILKARNETERKYGVGAAPDRPAGPGGAAPAQAPGTPVPGMKSTDDILRELGVIK